EEYGNIKGRYVCLDVHKAPFRNANGEVVGIVGSARDVTERQRIDRELQQYRLGLEELVQQRTVELVATEARASHILQSSADGLLGVDREGLITFINPAACRMFGYAPEQAIGRSAHALLHGKKADGSPYPAEECPGHAALAAGKPRRIDNEVLWHADGHGIPVMYAMYPMTRDGVHTGTVVSIVDMTVQHAAAQAREEALLAAENLARVRREFLANMSHEIRTPLNGVLGFAQIGMRNAGHPEKAHNAFEKIITSGNVLLGVINDILDFSKIDAGKIVIEQTEIDLSTVLEEVIDMVGARARGKQIELRLDRVADFPRACKGDALRLRQVLLNLLSNAIKFTEDGMVTLSSSLREGKLVFAVTDTGIG
ncbi:MAG: PAS domain S-box protein, partial [Betaproteobacteria bacterium]|nr:PAS domain S-box protein [Betaproteobacteria bacterium]